MSTSRVICVRTVLVCLVIAAVGTIPAAAQDAPRAGGILKAAMIGEPPTLDTHTTTATIAYQIAWHVFETLYTYDAMYASRNLKGFQGNPFLHFWNAWIAR